MIDSLGEIADPADLQRLNRAFPSRYPYLLQSTASGGQLGRFDILFCSAGETLELTADGALIGQGASPRCSFLDALDRWWSRERIPTQTSPLPFHGGWFLFLAYELAAEVEPGLHLPADAVLPVAFAARCRSALIFDHHDSQCYFVRETTGSFDSAQLHQDIDALDRTTSDAGVIVRSVSEENPERFVDAVHSAQDHIAAGDIYQVNLCREWTVELAETASAFDIYAALCRSNPGPFAGIARWRNTDIISSSPERLLRIAHGIASTRPIAGTRPRSADGDQDDILSAELFAHPKEVAEHVMLIDLERNDLGRVCDAGTVEVDEMMVLESYAHVHHIVSNVRGRVRKDVLPGQAIAAVFPGGTITGCPKVRCMEIIAELEQKPRGAYTGSFGYLNRDGSLDLNILIRTMVKQDQRLSFHAGSGIVADSVAAAELEETRAKAKGMLRAIGL